jgi:hypothetical protein
MSTEVTNISTFIETLKNAGVVITGEETVLNHLAAAQCPQKALLDLAMQGRRVGVTFYQRGLGVDFDLAAKAFLWNSGTVKITSLSAVLSQISEPTLPRKYQSQHITRGRVSAA